MNERARFTLYVAVALLAGAMGIYICYGRLSEARALAAGAGEDMIKCRELADSIVRLSSHRQNQMTDQPQDESSIDRRSEEAAQLANMSPEKLEKTSHPSPRRLGQSPYRENLTTIILKEVSMEETIRFLHALTGDSPSLRVQSLRFWTQKGNKVDALQDRWNVDLTLADLVYDPKTDSR